ncbi:hypothetical protein HUU59_04075 [bacterium]|nr:hypothetical protein [bacterium]
MRLTWCSTITLLILCVGQNAHAQWVIGRYAGEFMSLGAGARALAMGGASIASPLMSTAGYYNPAALATLEKRSAEFMHASQFDNLFTYDFASYATPMRSGVSGAISVLYARVGDIPLTKLSDPSRPLSDDNRVEVSGETGDHEFAVLASGGRELGNGWNCGASAKLLTKSLASETALGLGFDLAVQRRIGSHAEFGAIVKDLTTSTITWSTGRTESILPNVGVGGSWSAPLQAMNADITVVGDAEVRFETRGEAELIAAGPVSIEPRLGLEYLISKAVAIRAGVKGERFTAGAGLQFGSLAVHAALEDHEDLGLTHRASLGVEF